MNNTSAAIRKPRPPWAGPISTVTDPARIVALVSEHRRPKPARKSTVAERPRIVDLVHEHHRRKPAPTSTVAERSRIERHIEPSAPASALSLDLQGMSKLRAYARGPLAIVLIVLLIVGGKVWIEGPAPESNHTERGGLG